MRTLFNHTFLLLMLRHNGGGLASGGKAIALFAACYLLSALSLLSTPYMDSYLVSEIILLLIAYVIALWVGNVTLTGFMLIMTGVHVMVWLTPFIRVDYWFWWGVLALTSLVVRIRYVAPY